MFQKMTPAANNGAFVPVVPADFLIGRIAQQANYAQYAENRLQAGGSVSAPREAGENSSVTSMPIIRIMIRPGVATYEDMTPLITADGAPVPARTGGTFGTNLYAAGRMH